MTTITDYNLLFTISIAKDFIRNWATVGNSGTVLAQCGALPDTDADTTAIINMKYYIQANKTLSTTNAYGADPYVTSINDLCTSASAAINSTYSTLVNSVSTLTQFTVINTSKYDTLITSINTCKSALDAVGTTANNLVTAITATKNGITTTSSTVTTVKANYDYIINGLSKMATRFKTNLVNFLTDIVTTLGYFKSVVNAYNDEFTGSDKAAYMSGMNANFNQYLYLSTMFWIKSYIYQGLANM